MKKMSFAALLAVLFMFVACGDDPIVVKPDTEPAEEDSDVNDEDTAEPTDAAPETDEDTTPEPTGDECANENLGKQCATDTECGACMICVTGGKCVKGCTSDTDCTMAGTKCNTKLARCLSVLASTQACSEANCPAGCCYAEKGLTGLKCATGANATATTCGLCPQNQVYSPEDSKCIDAVCSTTTDNCPTLNSGATNPPAKCYACKSGEYICKANPSTSGCSAGVVINAAQCVPAGQQCVEGVSECCSGMPCVQGYCY